MQKLMWFSCGLLIGLTALSITKASVPTRSRVMDDTPVYNGLSEIREKKIKVNFDQALRDLELEEPRYKENLPSLARHARLKADPLKDPMKRVSMQKYRYSGRN